MTDVALTNHGKKRIRQRVGTKRTEELVQEAQQFGINVVEARGHLQSYMHSLARMNLEKGDPKHVLVHKGNVFIFKGPTLITMFPLPSNLKKLADSISKKKNHGSEMESNIRKEAKRAKNKHKRSKHANNSAIDDARQYIKDNSQDGLSVPLISPELAAQLAQKIREQA